MSKLNPTPEQQACIDAFHTDTDFVIEAGAGTGKTATLALIGEATDQQGTFIAFNKSAQLDAERRFPSNVDCRTGHSLAYKGMYKIGKKGLMRRLKSPRVPSSKKVEILGIPEHIQVTDEIGLRDFEIASLAMVTVKRYCFSADDEIGEQHVPWQEGRKEAHTEIAAHVLPYAEKIWKDANDFNGKLQFTHDYYVKIWALSRPTIPGDFLLLDEAQDTNPVFAKVFFEQQVQKVAVGDKCQAIYGWRGASDFLTHFADQLPKDRHLLLSQSFRFGEGVATEANKFLGFLKSPLKLKGFHKITSKVLTASDTPMDNPTCIICRTNATVIQHAMENQEKGRNVAIVGGTKEIEDFTKVAAELQRGEKNTYHPDLAAFGSWGQVTAYAQTEEGADLRVMVKLINDYGCDTILKVCENSTAKESDADLIVTTAHKAKGREWNHVLIANDFRKDVEGEPTMPGEAELKLLYVAVTRAINTLDALSLSFVDRAAELEAQAAKTADEQQPLPAAA